MNFRLIMGEGTQSEYLYGAAVQGIQGYIFRTNRLREIVDASDLVEEICTSFFDEMVQGMDVIRILNAAGNIKCVFRRRCECEKVVREFPMRVACMAPGITISQGVVEIDSDSGGNSGFTQNVELLEQRLRSQRNCPMPSLTIGKLGMERSRETGLPLAVNATKNDANKPTTLMLCKKSFGSWLQDVFGADARLRASHLAFNVEEITGKNDWLAIIHADGNGLGQIVQRIGRNALALSQFSKRLDSATKASANAAFTVVVERYGFKRLVEEKKPIPLRPVVLGGDDMTVICRGDMAMAYVEEFMRCFERETGSFIADLSRDFGLHGQVAPKLTACAGIAFIKSSYPFYYGYQLAENLCDRAKKDAKDEMNMVDGLAPSCVMFHKVQDSFVEDFSQIERRELTPCPGDSFVFGPYYLNDHHDRWTIKTLCEKCRGLESTGTGESNSVKTHLRRWLSQIHVNRESARRLIERAQSLQSDRNVRLMKELTEGVVRHQGRTCANVYPAYDVMSLYSILNQNTKEE